MSPIRQYGSIDADASDSRHATVARSGAWFSGLPPELQDALLGSARERRLDDRERLYLKGDAGDGLFCVVDGSLAATGGTRDGQQTMLARIDPPHWFGEISLIDGGPRTHDTWADGPAVVLHVPLEPLIAHLGRRPEHWRSLALLLARRTRTAFEALDETAVMPAIDRVARRLVLLSESYGDLPEGGRRIVRVPQDRLATMLALSRQTVNRALKQLEAEGSVRLTRGGAELLDLERLRGRAG
ncbi:MAG: Crp/Fnr family transcriptional regulator [Burkholderiales bacterium]|jgi:CRP-like cAMP-binding protein